MSDNFPAPSTPFPIVLPDGSAHSGTVFLKPVLKHPRFVVGEYTYASAHTPPDDWAAHFAPYLYDFSPEKLVIGKFCQIADGVTFITSSANHRHDGFSSFPFAVFGGDREGRPSMPAPGPDTVVGNDVWIGQGARILPGARIGSGAIIGAGSVVAGEVPDYAIYAGNPARLVRMRFDAPTVSALLKVAWWDWPINQIVDHESAICGADMDALRRAAPSS
ncbi:virginiamycin A acetyltransferase [Litoreibacter ascidiaceicola]|uniref:Virginiamycin A acetyltransferase n=1 Tax=Litoreibacter ascidiaceicola TaxID=1486859 RepID=A0A1M4XHP0_9RHOB|nr:CatB-related O-acetyltransferase [Litoreibacter ascidiaceicola]SHE92920.1 virginiamycin A acetyltransferase [Litoreibacter ascidiaceicola]